MIKIIYRVIGFNVYHDTRIIDALFAFGLMGMVFGSLSAIKENDIRRMIAFSSVAQIGYIYMGFGMGTQAGMTASVSIFCPMPPRSPCCSSPLSALRMCPAEAGNSSN